MIKILNSSLDPSINFISKASVGSFESRYVRRANKNVIYLSSQSGCQQACRMCHLTAMGETSLVNATLDDFIEQTRRVAFRVASSQDQPNLHVNFMARGEPLLNPTVTENWKELSDRITKEIRSSGISSKIHFIISSIFPKPYSPFDILQFVGPNTPRIYWSAYSSNPAFRKQWLPNAHDFYRGLATLSLYYRATRMTPRIHFALIENQNDSLDDIAEMTRILNEANFPVDINIVRYNPYSEKYGRESPNVDQCVEYFRKNLTKGNVKVIMRVGEDISASCGQFVNSE